MKTEIIAPAFPLPRPIDETKPYLGLTKREYFAAKAMQGMMADSEITHDYVGIAEDAVRHADALIEALNK